MGVDRGNAFVRGNPLRALPIRHHCETGSSWKSILGGYDVTQLSISRKAIQPTVRSDPQLPQAVQSQGFDFGTGFGFDSKGT